ncbi:Hypothetical protein SRAE_2000062700 [Strongyloides ratti]|uniref:Uncharacterized protein n=1 Tax=Strongyloides ratti TaxID=34506 RepID=A0A090LCV0_STRRB|nr:Hypothetical protein SRAE_2000062700 [Strongyloides ratti]CEF65953.1 Hypothetical protein SRAE_2000062700 [Strongyloides ratti]
MYIEADVKIILIRVITLFLTFSTALIIVLGPGYCIEFTKNSIHGMYCDNYYASRWNFKMISPYLHTIVILFGFNSALVNALGIYNESIIKRNQNLITIYFCIAIYCFCGLTEILIYFNIPKTFFYSSSNENLNVKVYGYLGAGIIYIFAAILAVLDFFIYRNDYIF